MRRLAGRGLLIVAVAAPLSRGAVVQWINWTPLEIPLRAEPGAVEPREFSVDQAGAYELAVRIDRPADRARHAAAECALGFDFVECEGSAPMRLRWYLRSHDWQDVRCGTEPAGARLVEARSSGGRFTPAFVERWLGCFDADERTRYSLQVEVLSGLEAVASLHPRFLILPSSQLDRDQHSLTAAVWLTSLLVGLAGAVVVSHRERDGARRRHEIAMTFRRQLIELLSQEPRSASSIAHEMGLRRADLDDDLKHAIRSAAAAGHRIEVIPARCKDCGFVFGTDRLIKPGRCPSCRGSRLFEPMIRVAGA
jgi:hypothetical protein